MLLLLWVEGAAAAPGPPALSVVPGGPQVLSSNVPPLPKALVERVHQYAEVRSARLEDVSEDGRRLLVATAFGRTPQLHRVSQPLGAREQLTFFDAPVGKAAFLPGDPFTLVFLQETEGGEFYQLRRLDLRTGRTEALSEAKSRTETFVLSREGRWIAYSGTGRNGLDADVYLAEVADAHTARRLTELPGTWLPLEFSPDGRQLLLSVVRGEDDSDVVLLDIASGAHRSLTPDAHAEGRAVVRAARFSADGESVYLLTDRGSDFTTLRRVELARPVAALAAVAAELPGEVEQLAVAKDGTLALSSNVQGTSRLYLLRGSRLEALPLPQGVLSALRFPRDRSDVLFLSLETPTSPKDVWALSLKSKRLTRWTKSEVGGLDTQAFVSPERLAYQAEDGLSLQALLYRPRDVPAGTRVPVVVAWHDGPAAQARPDFRPEVQLLLEQGMAVLAPNVRGSEGFGKAFRAADDGLLREHVLLDIAATLALVERTAGLDRSRVAAWGSGYGGYLALACVAFYPSSFRAAAALSPLFDLATFAETAAPYRREQARAEYGDERRAEVRAVQQRLSPLHAASAIQGGLLLVQGGKDIRAPRAQAEQLLSGRGTKGWYLFAPEEGHGFRAEENRELASAVLVLFLEQSLRAGPLGTPQ